MNEGLKRNIKNGSKYIIKFFVPELDLDWDSLYFVIKERKDSLKWKLKKRKFKYRK